MRRPGPLSALLLRDGVEEPGGGGGAPRAVTAHVRTTADVPAGALLGRWLLDAVAGAAPAAVLRLDDGSALPLELDRWAGPTTPADDALLAPASGPVLDAGCGPGRLTAALHQRGTAVLGLDVLPAVPVLARRAGAPVHVGDVLGPVPGEGAFATVLLADGNVGIGGDPAALLRRARGLIARGGTVLVELAAADWSGRARLEGEGVASAPFAWALVGSRTLPAAAAGAGLQVVDTWAADGRRFAALR